LEKVFREHGTQVFCGTQIQRVVRRGKSKRVEFIQAGKRRHVEAEQILQALGREPDLGGLAVEKAGVRLVQGKVDSGLTQQTSVPHIFAAGDVCGPYEVVHLAIQQGEVAAKNAGDWIRGKGLHAKMDYRMKLEVIFTSPEVASVGLSEKECKEKGLDILSGSYPFADHGKSIVMGELNGFVKLIALKQRGEIVGAEVVGPRASDLIHEPMAIMRYRGTAKDMAEMPHYHPTLSEIWTYPAEEIAEKILA
jgi:pyruvate/2-oxoglutarate dehydrogenase complex dihydrolipoamide dehydrogenase (E3) component